MKISDLQTEQQIFGAAAEVFTEKGFDGARMHEIASRAGINKALLHYYFRSKENLFDEVFRKLASNLLEKFTPVFKPGMTLEEKIGFFLREHIEFLRQNPRLPSFILNEINRNPARISKLFPDIDFGKVYDTIASQHGKELEKYNITPEVMPQIMASIAAMSVFPFIARGILEGILKNLGQEFNSFIEERKEFAPEFVMGALKSRKKTKKSKK